MEETKGGTLYELSNTLYRLQEEKNTHYCLNRTKLSFFDNFTPVNGIPGYLMILEKSKSVTENNNLAPEPGSSNTVVQGVENKKTQAAPGTPFLLNGLKQTTTCSFSLDSTRFAISYVSGDVAIWDTDHGTLIKEKTIDGSQVSAVSFLGDSNTILLVCTQDYKCLKWNMDGGDDSNPTELLDTKELSKIKEEVHSQRSDFFANGTKLVLSTLANCSEGRKLSIVLVNTTSENPMSIEHAYFPLSLEENFVVSQVSMSSDADNLLVGLMDEEMENSYCMVWPDFITKPDLHRKLDIGTIGSWSHDSKYVVTWTMMGMSSLEDINRSSAFIWNIEKIKEDPGDLECTFEQKITSPFKEQVFWCQITEYVKRKDRLIMGLVGETTRFLFWDIESEVHTHTIETGIPTKEMIICNKEAWISYSTRQINVKGLSPMDVTQDGKYFGAVLGWPSQVLIWDARLGIQVLNVSPKDLQANHFKGGINLMASPSCRKFAIIGNEGAMVFCPSIANEFKSQKKQLLETQMVELANQGASQDKHSKFKMKFSGNGDILGVLCIGLTKMQLWNLPKGDTYILDAADFGGGNINDFCLSNNGEHLAAYTDDNILVWKYEAKTMQPISRIKINSEVVDMGIKDDGSKIVLCMKNGSILIYYKTRRANTSNVDDENRISVRTPSMQGNTEQQHDGPSSSEIKPLLGKDSVTDQTLPEDTGSNAPILMEYHYEMRNRLGELEAATFQVSPSFERVIRVSQSQKGEAWDLEEERVIKGANIDARSIPRSSRSYSSVSSINESVFEKLQSTEIISLFDGTSINLSKQTTVIQSSKEHIIVAANASSSGLVQKADSTHYDVEYEADKHEDSHSVYVINLEDNKCRRRLCGKNLNPKKGLAISEDGRHVACFAGENASKVVVWNAYGSATLLPDYHFLSLNHAIGSKSAIKNEVVQLIDTYGLNFIQFRHPSGLSILDEAMWYVNNTLIKTLLLYVSKKKVKVSFMFPRKNVDEKTPIGYSNMIEVLIAGKSPKTLKITLKYLLERVTHEAETATTFECSLPLILQKYPKIFACVIRDRKFLGSRHDIEVPESLLEGNEFIAETSDSLNMSSEETAKFWKEKSNEPNKSSSLSTILVTTGSVPYEGLCNIGKSGLLHNLFIYRAHCSAFGSFIIEAIVEYKWKTYARQLLIQEAFHHGLVSLSFTIYCAFLNVERTHILGSEYQQNEESSICTLISLHVCQALAALCLHREICQCVLHIRGHQWRGFIYWMKSAWNWLEAFCYINVVIIIPLGHHLFLSDGDKTFILSAFVAIESLLIWSRMLFYARPFRRTGPLVITISSIFGEIVYFLSLALSVMFGFALAFQVLYRHVEISKEEDRTTSSPCNMDFYDDDDDDHLRSMHQAFGTFKRSFYTIFSYTFGDFEMENLYKAPEPFTALTLFVLYVVLLAIILLNMLIALMGEKFTRIHKQRKAQFTKARARAIEDIDSMLSNKSQEELNKDIKKYLQIGVPSHHHERKIKGSRLERSQSKHMKEINVNIRDNIRREVNRSLSAQFGLARASIESSSVARNLPLNLHSHMTPIPENSEQPQSPVENLEQPCTGAALLGRNTMVRKFSVLMTTHESNELQRAPVEQQEEWYNSDSNVSEISESHSDIESD
eukprot:g9054.t1